MANLRYVFDRMLHSGAIQIAKYDVSTMLPNERNEFVGEEVSRFYNNRIKTIEKDFSLFQLSNTVPYPEKINTLEKDEMVPGTLYRMSFNRMEELLGSIRGREQFEYQLFYNMIRNGEQLTIPIYKMFYNVKARLRMNVINSDVPLYIDTDPSDNFFIVLGDSMRTSIREIKRQKNFSKTMQSELAGAAGEFDEDKL